MSSPTTTFVLVQRKLLIGRITKRTRQAEETVSSRLNAASPSPLTADE